MHRYLFLFLFFPLCFISQERELDSLRGHLRELPEDTNKVKTLNYLCKKLWGIGFFDEAMDTARLALHLSEKLNFQKGIADACDNMGVVNDYLGNFHISLDWYKKALIIREKLNDKLLLAKTIGNIAIANMGKGNYAESVKMSYRALPVFELLNDRRAVAFVLNNIAAAYMKMNQLEDALSAVEKGIAQRSLLSDKTGMGDAIMVKAGIYAQMKRLDSAGSNYSLAFRLYEADKNLYGMATCVLNNGNLLSDKGLFKESMTYFNKAVSLYDEMGDQQGTCIAHINMGTTYSAMKNYPMAEKEILKAKEIGLMIGGKGELDDVYLWLSRIYEKQARFKESLEAYRIYIVYRDSVINEENTRATVQNHMQYEFEKEAAADSVRNVQRSQAQKLLHDQKLSEQKIYTWVALGGLLLMLLVAFISYKAFADKRKAAALIEEQKRVVEEKQREILDSIRYARRIQQALITSERYIAKTLARVYEKKGEL